jgi:hypothetical protein
VEGGFFEALIDYHKKQSTFKWRRLDDVEEQVAVTAWLWFGNY